MRVRYSISEQWKLEDIHEVLDAVKFAISYFGIEDPKSTLTIKLINGTFESVEASADRIKNKRYEIRLARQQIANTLDALLLALFHEMTHVKQFVRDGFRISGTDFYWNNTLDKAEYWESPWEMEARAMERLLVAKYDQIR